MTWDWLEKWRSNQGVAYLPSGRDRSNLVWLVWFGLVFVWIGLVWMMTWDELDEWRSNQGKEWGQSEGYTEAIKPIPLWLYTHKLLQHCVVCGTEQCTVQQCEQN